MIETSRLEPGCVEYGYAQDVLEPDLIHVRELWRDRTALDRHFASDHIRTWRSAWDHLGIGERDLTLHIIDDGTPT